MSGTEWFCGVQLGGVKLPAVFPAARNSKSMVHAGTGRWRQKNGRPMLIVGSRLAVYRMAVVIVRFFQFSYHLPVFRIFDINVFRLLVCALVIEFVGFFFVSKLFIATTFAQGACIHRCITHICTCLYC